MKYDHRRWSEKISPPRGPHKKIRYLSFHFVLIPPIFHLLLGKHFRLIYQYTFSHLTIIHGLRPNLVTKIFLKYWPFVFKNAFCIFPNCKQINMDNWTFPRTPTCFMPKFGWWLFPWPNQDDRMNMNETWQGKQQSAIIENIVVLELGRSPSQWELASWGWGTFPSRPHQHIFCG